MTGRSARVRAILAAGLVAFAATMASANPSTPSSSSSSSKTTTTRTVASTDPATELYNQGLKLSDQKEYAKAAEKFQSAIAANKDYVEAYNMLGFSLRHLGDYQKALAAYRTALKMRPDFAEAHEYIGEAYLSMGDLADAVRHYMILQKLKKAEQAADLWGKISAYVEGISEKA